MGSCLDRDKSRVVYPIFVIFPFFFLDCDNTMGKEWGKTRKCEREEKERGVESLDLNEMRWTPASNSGTNRAITHTYIYSEVIRKHTFLSQVDKNEYYPNLRALFFFFVQLLVCRAVSL